MQQLSEQRARSSTGRTLATAALALLCVTALSQPNTAYAHGGGGGSHGGGGGFHGGEFRGGGFRGTHFGHDRDDFRHRGGDRDDFRRRGGFGGWWGGGVGWDAPYYDYGYPDYGSYGYSQSYAAQYWYYCQDPAGYYPYVQQCSTTWQTVPAS